MKKIVLAIVIIGLLNSCTNNSVDISKYKKYLIGNHQIEYLPSADGGPHVRIKNPKVTDKVIWETNRSKKFVSVKKIKTIFSQYRIHFYLDEEILDEYENSFIENVLVEGNSVVFSGSFEEAKNLSFKLIFQESAYKDHLDFKLEITDNKNNKIENVVYRACLTYSSSSDEHFFGLGEQFTYLDQKGKRVPLLVNEQGHGRGKEPITTFQKLFHHGAGGKWYSTYIPIAQYVSSKARSLYLHNYEYTIFDFTDDNSVTIEVNSPSLSGAIIAADSTLDCIEKYTQYSGRMRPLPDWIGQGAVVCLQGGSEKVRELYSRLKQYDVPISGVWLHDWQGRRVMGPNNTRLWWNWVASDKEYPDLENMIRDFRKDGVRTLAYNNPFLTDVSVKKDYKGRNLFREAEEAGYFLKDESGNSILLDNGGFFAALIDLSNPAARSWMKDVIKKEMIEKGISGWMCDFAEAVPYYSKPYSGESANTYHNKYPEEWAKLNREAIEEAGLGKDIVFFSRSGNKMTPRYSTLIWAGDQIVTWDSYDGIKTAVTALIGGGFSGLALNHSDTGGLVAITQSFINWQRTPEILARWMEMNAFTPVLRTHEGGNPVRVGHQVYDSPQTMKLFARSAKVYAALASYRKHLMNEMEEKGYPLVRHPLLHFEDDPNVLELEYQFMLGSDFMIVPVLDEGEDEVEVYLPEGIWIHLWTGKRYVVKNEGLYFEVNAPIGSPAVFYLDGSKYGKELSSELKKQGIIK